MPKPEFVLVPREPTEEMRQIGGETNCPLETLTSACNYAVEVYRAMISAAPPSPSVDEEMLEALKAADEHLAEYIREVGGLIVPAKSMRLLDKIRAAITRATGGRE